jgi:hypothetical protein
VTKNATASVRVVGAVLQLTPLQLSGFASNQTKQFLARNIGNTYIYLSHASSQPAFAIVNGTNQTLLDPQGGLFDALTVDVRFIATTAGTYSADITTSRVNAIGTGPLCMPAAVVRANAALP